MLLMQWFSHGFGFLNIYWIVLLSFVLLVPNKTKGETNDVYLCCKLSLGCFFIYLHCCSKGFGRWRLLYVFEMSLLCSPRLHQTYSKNSDILLQFKIIVFEYIAKCNLFLWSLLQYSVSHDPSEIILCWFAAKETLTFSMSKTFVMLHIFVETIFDE